MRSSHVKKWYHNMLLILSVTFHCHNYKWGRMCSTVPFQFSLLKGYIHSSCYNHHQIGSIIISVFVCLRCLLHHILSRIAYSSLENRDFVFIIIVQFMMSANCRMRFVLQIVFVCLYITPSHYRHCANLSEGIELMKCLSDILCRLYNIKHTFSSIHYKVYGAVCFQFTLSPCDGWGNIHIV